VISYATVKHVVLEAVNGMQVATAVEFAVGSKGEGGSYTGEWDYQGPDTDDCEQLC